MADCHLPEVPQGPSVSSTIYYEGSRIPTRSKRSISLNRFLSSEEQRVNLRTRAELFPRRFNNDYEDLRIITSRDDHGCTSDRLIGIY
jgi:hypothetical protein